MKPNRSPSYKIPIFKYQITNKSQIPIFNDQNIWDLGHCDLFVICDLLFGILKNPLRHDQPTYLFSLEPRILSVSSRSTFNVTGSITTP